MNKVIETLCLNGPNQGMHKLELDYTQEQEDLAKAKLEVNYEGIIYAGWCRDCNILIVKGQEAYTKNVDGLGKLQVDVFHKHCLWG
ncbi:hypothetical protein [Cellulosilyticum sp. WCF-2]|uniref:hypothetical protein n=1 Tax=Cellulosilyticum sp. WCF-2 TaxID=2497860 RepID=UPI000F8E86D9|nr:hypothetical protein [Cellulosilyticum sp. WCF-2]QEH69942.1 hypothetical protein EKH84_16690 [Cellulosilyticum sp. WCF-2]